MFEFSCSKSRLINWLLSQVASRSEVIFPRKKNWEYYLGLLYPNYSKACSLMVLVTDGFECIAFLPLDDIIDKQLIKKLDPRKFQEVVRREADFTFESFQLVFLTSEKLQPQILQILEKVKVEAGLMVLTADKVIFSKGNFANPRLEYRLSRLNFDPDLIPEFLTVDLAGIDENRKRSTFYQNLFHILSRDWILGEPKIVLRKVVSEIMPHWKLCGKSERQELLKHVKADLEKVFKKYFDKGLHISHYQKKSNSRPETVIILPEPPKTKKEINTWTRKQALALDSLRDNHEQISIDLSELST